MGIERESAVRKAEELVREGKVDLAIDEYLRLVDDQPGDVGAANALGDLYVKVGNRAAAVAQFAQIGDNHRESGFIPKAVAFYKKALKVDPASDHALSQLAQIAVEQELYADATLYLNRLLQCRREQNNDAGVAECLVRIGGFPTATADAKLAAARASTNHFPSDRTARLWVDAADALERAGRAGEAVDVLMQAASLEPDDMPLRRRVALACATTGQIDRARAFLSLDTAGDHPDLLLALAGRALAEGRDDEARQALERVLAVAPDRRTEAETMLAPLVQDSGVEPTAHPIPADFFSVDASMSADADVPLDVDVPLDAAAAFGTGHHDAPALDPLEAAGEGAAVPHEHQALAEPPAVAPEPQAPAASSLDWAALLGDPGADADAITEPPGADAAGAVADAIDSDDTSEPVVLEEDGLVEIAEEAFHAPDDAAASPEAAPPLALAPEPGGASETEPQPEPAPEAEEEPEPAQEPVAVVEAGAAPAPSNVASTEATATELDSIAALTAAADNPALQFQASAQIGRMLLRLGRTGEGIAWLERATQASTFVREQRLDVMYELADGLERAGQLSRALDVFADLDFDAASYRDVPDRMASLRRALEEGRAP